MNLRHFSICQSYDVKNHFNDRKKTISHKGERIRPSPKFSDFTLNHANFLTFATSKKPL